MERYLPYLAKKSGVSPEELQGALSLLPLTIFPQTYYKRKLASARKLLYHIDPHDADLLALYLIESTYLWSEDRDFEKVSPPIRLLKTRDFF